MYPLIRSNTRIIILALLLVSFFGSLLFTNSKASADELLFRSDTLSNPTTSAVSTHLVSFQYANTTTPIAAVQIQFCSNSPIINIACTAPPGLNLASAVLSQQVGNTGFALTSQSGDTLVITRSASVPSSAQSNYQFDDIINPSSPGTYYVRFQTFATTNTSLPDVDQGGDAIAIEPAFNVTATVPPYLAFCAAVTIANVNCSSTNGSQINFGYFHTSNTSSATSQFVVATNAGNGYNVSVNGSTMTSGINTIPASTSPTAALIGNAQFGLNLTSNSIPSVGSGPVGSGTATVVGNYNNSNKFLFNTGDEVVTSPGPSYYQRFTTSYIVNISPASPVGIYATTITFICLANF